MARQRQAWTMVLASAPWRHEPLEEGRRRAQLLLLHLVAPPRHTVRLSDERSAGSLVETLRAMARGSEGSSEESSALAIAGKVWVRWG